MKGVLWLRTSVSVWHSRRAALKESIFNAKAPSGRSEATFKVPIFAFDNLHKADDDEEGMKEEGRKG